MNHPDFMCPVCKAAPLITDYCPTCSRIEYQRETKDSICQMAKAARRHLDANEFAQTAYWLDEIIAIGEGK